MAGGGIAVLGVMLLPVLVMLILLAMMMERVCGCEG